MASKVLIVGDMHVVPEELTDCSALVQHILTVCRTEDVTEVWFTGDQHHTHAVLRLEAMHWWRVAFKALRAEGISSVCLVGNHDQASPGSPMHAMMAYEGLQGVAIIDKPTVRHGVLLVPYMHAEEEFVVACRAASLQGGPGEPPETQTVFCHQTFDGSTFENGFLASDGFNPNLVPQELLISGHIHSGQEFGKVWYVGAPRWRSLSDANVERAVWVVEFEDGKVKDRRPYSTGDVCRQILHREDTPEKPVQLPLDARHQWRVDVRGPIDWCQQRKKELVAAGARIRTFPTQVRSQGRVRESEGIATAFRGFLGSYQAKFGTSREVLEQMAKERLSV